MYLDSSMSCSNHRGFGKMPDPVKLRNSCYDHIVLSVWTVHVGGNHIPTYINV